MCGIVGIYNLNQSSVIEKELKNFTNSLIHRGPDAKGIYINENRNLGLGHRRLSILDLSNRANQPMIYNHNYVIVYNGEIYNFLELKSELENLGYKFKTNSDTEVILASYMAWGEECQKKFNGMWALAIWNNRLKKLFLSRDRFGIKPLYYLHYNEKFFFASELKAFMTLDRNNVPEFDYNNLVYSAKTSFHRTNSVMEDTFLKNVKELNPGYQLVINSNYSFKLKKWWTTIDNLIEIPKKYDSQVEKFKYLFLNACKLRLRSDVKIATSLSGGIDSSSVVSSILHLNSLHEKLQNSQFPHHTFILDYKDEFDIALHGNEIEYAKLAINNTNVEAKFIELNINKVIPEEIIKIIYYQEEVSGSDGLGPWYIYKNIKKNGIKVSIDGHGSDEQLAGYFGYTKLAMNECNPIKNFYRWLDLMFLYIKITDNSDEKNYIKQILNKAISYIKVKYSKKKKSIIDDDYFKIESREPSRLVQENISSLSFLNRVLYEDFHYKVNPYNLKRYDKFSMAHGIESRNPFLDWRIVTFLFSLPSKSKIGSGFTKRILRDSMKGIVNNEILKRIKKKGFNPTNKLFNQQMSGFIHDSVNNKDFLESNIWDGKKIKNHINDNKKIEYKKIFKYIQMYYLIKTFKSNKSQNWSLENEI